MAKKSRKEKIEEVLWKFRSGDLTVDEAHDKICDADHDDGEAEAQGETPPPGPPTGGGHPGGGTP